MKKLNKQLIKQNFIEYLCDKKTNHLFYLKNALKIASASKNISGGIECYNWSIRECIKVLFILRYKQESLQEVDKMR